MKYSGSAPAFLDRLAMLLALLAGLALYLPALRLELLADDFVFLARARTLPLLPWLGTTGGASYYRPVSRQIYFWGMSHLFGAAPLPYHIVSLGLYLTCAGLLAALAWKLAGARAGILAAIFFVAQHGGSVLTGWACGTQDLFGLLFTIAAIGLHLRGQGAAALAAMALGLLSKETAVVVPFAILALEGSRMRRSGRSRHPSPVGAAQPYLVLLGVWAILYLGVFRNLPGKLPEAPVLDLHAGFSDLVRGIRLSLAGLANLEEGRLALPGLLEDRLRLAAGTAFGLLAVALVGGRTRTGKIRPSPASGPSSPGSTSLARLGAVWAGVSLLPLALIGHRWSAYDNAMVGAGAALALAGLLSDRRLLALLAAAFLLLSGPCADAVSGGENQAGLHSLWSLSSLRRLSEFVSGLRTRLLETHPRLEPGTQVLLANIPPMALLSIYQSDALRAWYADSTLVMSTVHAGADPQSLPARFFVMDCDVSTRPYTWRVEGPEWQRALTALGRAQGARQRPEFLSILKRLRAQPEWNGQPGALRGRILRDGGRAARELGDLPRADSLYLESAQADSTHSESFFGRGLVALAMNRNEGADSVFTRALALDPGNPEVLYALALAHIQLRRPDAADLLRQSLEAGLQEPGRSAAARLVQALAGDKPGSSNP